MAPSRFTLRLLFVVTAAAGCAAAAVGCSDTDPNYGSPESIRGRKIVFPGAVTPPAASDSGTPGVPKTAAALFGELYNGVGAAAGITATCAGAGCHSPNGGGVTLFLGANEATAYAIFKEKNYKDITIPAPKGFFLKPQHSGPPLTADQATVGKAWAAAETAGGGATPVADAGAD